jgi:hypothetical protein
MSICERCPPRRLFSRGFRIRVQSCSANGIPPAFKLWFYAGAAVKNMIQPGSRCEGAADGLRIGAMHLTFELAIPVARGL